MAVPSTRLAPNGIRDVDLTREESHPRTLPGGDHEAAFDRLYREFSIRVVGLVRKFTSDEDQIDDIVQETFLRAYNAGLHLEYAEETDDDRSQWPWLAAVARNLSLDMLRKRKAVVEDEIDDELIDIGLYLDDPEVRFLATRRREGILEALNEMSPRQRRLLVLKHVQGVGYVDLARREGISVEALKSVVARARRTFKQAYASIAEHHGLGVVTGGVLAAGRERLRALRDRILGAPDALNAMAAGSPTLSNAVVSLTVLGAMGVVGAVAGDVTVAPAEPTPIVAATPAPVDTPIFVEAPGSVEVVDNTGPRSVDTSHANPEPPVEAVPHDSAPVGPSTTKAQASVSTDELLPREDAPASTTSEGQASFDDQDMVISLNEADAIDIGDEETLEPEGQASVSAGCGPSESWGTAKGAACPVLTDDPNAGPGF